MGERIEELLARVRARIETSPSNPGLCLDVTAAARATPTKLSPVQAWATCRLRDQPTGNPTVNLDEPTLARLADICGLQTHDLTDQLTRAGLVRPQLGAVGNSNDV